MHNYEITYHVTAESASDALDAGIHALDTLNQFTPVLNVWVEESKPSAKTFGDKPGVKRLTEPYPGD